MATFHLILTSDYEVWGDGSGCVENCVIDPTNEMLEIADKYQVKITFFFDVCEYWAFEKIESEKRFNGDYRPATIMKEQLQNAMRSGHDVQLHFHPQWLNYKFISNQSWKLDHRYWKLPEVEHYHNDDWNIVKLFEKGVTTLNELFLPVNPNYSVYAFRAGSWCIQPEKEVIKAMRAHGIIIDSTVASGKTSIKENNEYNFKDVVSEPFWEIGDKVINKGNSGIYEFPITTAQLSIFKELQFKVKKFAHRKSLLPKGCNRKANNAKSTYINSIQKLLNRQPTMLNYSDGCTFEEMKAITLSAISKHKLSKEVNVPLVAISHSKTFGFSTEFEKYLKWVQSSNDLLFSSFNEFSKNLN